MTEAEYAAVRNLWCARQALWSLQQMTIVDEKSHANLQQQNLLCLMDAQVARMEIILGEVVVEDDDPEPAPMPAQRGPSSVAKIQAEVKQVRKEVEGE